MKCSLPNLQSFSPFSTVFTRVLAATFLMAVACVAQDQATTASESSPQTSQTAAVNNVSVTIPPGTRFALVLTQPVQTRYLHRGDDVYAQITSPVNSGNQVVIPPGTFVQGKLDKIERRGGIGELHLETMSITFPDGYVAQISGPAILQSNEGYALKDPGPGRGAAAIALPLGGIGLGALIGHSVGSSQSVMTTTLPPGCTGPPPGCLSSSMNVPGSKFKDTAIGASVGGVIGMFASIAMLVSSHHFFLAVGTPVEMTLQQPITLQQNEVTAAVQQAAQHPAPEQPIAPLPLPQPPPPPTTPANHGTCWTPGTPGTPPTSVPGPPNADGTPGPPIIIPGTPPTPGTPYPCP